MCSSDLRLSTAINCPTKDLLPLAPVLETTSAHSPWNLTSASLIYYPVMKESERGELWRRAMHADSSEAITIGRVMSELYADGTVPIETFPEDPQILRTLHNDIFKPQLFPNTNRILSDKLLEASKKLPWTGLRKEIGRAHV